MGWTHRARPVACGQTLAPANTRQPSAPHPAKHGASPTSESPAPLADCPSHPGATVARPAKDLRCNRSATRGQRAWWLRRCSGFCQVVHRCMSAMRHPPWPCCKPASALRARHPKRRKPGIVSRGGARRIRDCLYRSSDLHSACRTSLRRTWTAPQCGFQNPPSRAAARVMCPRDACCPAHLKPRLSRAQARNKTMFGRAEKINTNRLTKGLLRNIQKSHW